MNNCELIIEFYEKLLLLLRYVRFNTEVAEDAVNAYQKAGHLVSLVPFTMTDAREMFQHREEHVLVAESAFQDLAPYLRIPMARRVVRDFIRLSETDTESDTYVHVANRRLLGQDLDGPAVVTVVVNSYRTFTNLIAGYVEQNVHGSYGYKVPEI